MLNIAHRGFSDQYPENTLEAFIQAYKIGFDGAETDVHLTKDGRLVLIHDEDIKRTSDGRGYVKDMTLEELRQYNYKYKNDGYYAIPLLEELLEFIKGKNFVLNIEIKTDRFHYEGIEEKVIRMVHDYGVENQILYSSFYLPSLLKIRELDRNAYIGYLIEDSYERRYQELLDYNIKAIHPRYDFINEKTMNDFKEHGISVATWTIPNKKEYERLKSLGVYASISNMLLK